MNEYQCEAAECEAIVLATVLNPQFRQKFFELHYPEYKFLSKTLIKTAFTDLLEESELHNQTPLPEASNNTEDPDKADEFDVFGGSNDDSGKSSTLEL